MSIADLRHNLVRLLLTRRFIIWCATFVTATVFVIVTFRSIGVWLLAADPPPGHLDLICTFAVDKQRVAYSKLLAKRHPGARWFLSDYRNGYGRILQQSGYNMKRVTVVDTCTSTLSEIKAIGRFIDSAFSENDSQPVHIGLVSSPYHMRRISIMAGRYLKKRTRIRCYLLPAALSSYHWTEASFRFWWRKPQTTGITLQEIGKIGYFFLTGFF